MECAAPGGHLEPQLLQLGQVRQVCFADAVQQLAILGLGVAVSGERHHVTNTGPVAAARMFHTPEISPLPSECILRRTCS